MAKNRNPRLNSSGYMDMTAFYAIRAADRETRKKKRKPNKVQKSNKQGRQPSTYIKENGGIFHDN